MFILDALSVEYMMLFCIFFDRPRGVLCTNYLVEPYEFLSTTTPFMPHGERTRLISRDGECILSAVVVLGIILVARPMDILCTSGVFPTSRRITQPLRPPCLTAIFSHVLSLRHYSLSRCIYLWIRLMWEFTVP